MSLPVLSPLSSQTSFTPAVKVSVCCVTYNHAPYIRQALDGFLQQRTDFCVEILVHDDASTDGTAEIVADYAQRYPGVIKAVLQSENQYSQGVNVMAVLRESAQGDYLAYCEGDDYWQDPNKLYQQAHYLDHHFDTVMVGHATQRIRADGTLIPEPKATWYRSAFNLNASMSGYQLKTLYSMVPTCCKMFRRIPLYPPENAKNTPYSDAIKQSLLGQHGKYHFIEGLQPAVYRVHDQGVWSKDTVLVQQRKMLGLYRILWGYYFTQNDFQAMFGFTQKILISLVKYSIKQALTIIR